MSVTIKVEDFADDTGKLYDPISAWGSSHNTIWRMYNNGRPGDTFFIGCGHAERCVSIWWDDECGNFRLSSESKKELKRFLPHIKIRKCGPLTSLKIELNIEDYDA